MGILRAFPHLSALINPEHQSPAIPIMTVYQTLLPPLLKLALPPLAPPWQVGMSLHLHEHTGLSQFLLD